MRKSSITSRLFVLMAATHLFPLAPPALAQTDLHSEQQKLTAIDALGGASFGFSVAVRGNRAIVGAPRADGAGNQSGSASVFRASPINALWLQESKLTASDAATEDQFGYSVAVFGDWAVVGARKDDDGGNNSGSAYIFRRDDKGTPSDPSDDAWIEATKLTASDAGANDEFGYSVSMSGERIVVGARFDNDVASSSGSVYVFRREDKGTPSDPGDDVWIEETKLTASDAEGGETFGSAVSIGKDRIVVGAQFADTPGGIGSGAAYVFRVDDNGTTADLSDDVWFEEAKLTASGSSNQFGRAASISGDRALVGAQNNSAYVFRLDNSGTPQNPDDDGWVQEAKLVASDAAEAAEFGYSVALSGDRALVGALFGNAPWAADSGSAYFFQREDSGTPVDPIDDVWIQESKLVASDASFSDFLGFSVALSGGRAIAGAPFDAAMGAGSEAGHGSAYAYTVSEEVPAGQVPDGNGVAGLPLILSEETNDRIRLSWDDSCSGDDTDYEIYEGALGDFASHIPLVCSTGGSTTKSFVPAAGDTYYLVVPSNGFREGGYGADSAGNPRPLPVNTCLPQSIGSCE
jgi:hypothetical protein